METKGSQESLQSRLSFFHHGRLFSSDRDDSSDSDDYLETGLKEMLCLILQENSFHFNGKDYLQTHGSAMGTKMAVALFANIFMAKIEKERLGHTEREKTR